MLVDAREKREALAYRYQAAFRARYTLNAALISRVSMGRLIISQSQRCINPSRTTVD
ncbi:MAG: hypothetical protein ACJ0RQ_03220 [Candidatus Azotimanducaceae bacterium]